MGVRGQKKGGTRGTEEGRRRERKGKEERRRKEEKCGRRSVKKGIYNTCESVLRWRIDTLPTYHGHSRGKNHSKYTPMYHGKPILLPPLKSPL